jgi:hypothetical protein
MSAVTATTTVHPTGAADEDAFGVEDLRTSEELARRRSVEAWLERLWGIRTGQSSPVSQPITYALEPWIAIWLHRLWGMAPLPESATGGHDADQAPRRTTEPAGSVASAG